MPSPQMSAVTQLHRTRAQVARVVLVHRFGQYFYRFQVCGCVVERTFRMFILRDNRQPQDRVGSEVPVLQDFGQD